MIFAGGEDETSSTILALPIVCLCACVLIVLASALAVALHFMGSFHLLAIGFAFVNLIHLRARAVFR